MAATMPCEAAGDRCLTSMLPASVPRVVMGRGRSGRVKVRGGRVVGAEDLS